jgi:hypothetical protein
MSENTYIGLFILASDGYYVCGCGEFDVNKERMLQHLSTKIEGHCKNGMRIGDRLMYKCVCGNEFASPRESEYHYNNRSCMAYAITRLHKTCKLCNIEFEQYSDLDRHKKSKRHIKLQSGELLSLRCNTCNIQCISQNQMKTHLETKKHKKLLLNGIPADVELECKICKLVSKNQVNARKHLETKKHKDMVASGKIADDKISLTCDSCKITCPSQNAMRVHLQTKKHKKLLRINDIRQSVDTKETNE